MINNPVLAQSSAITIQRQKICEIVGETYSEERWHDWQWQMRHRLTKLEHFEKLLRLTPSEIEGLMIAPDKFAVAVTPYFASLLDPEEANCPLRIQVIPKQEEIIVNPTDMVDPCGEDNDSPVPGLVHRYPDRVLLLALDTCAAYCRYCTRSRLVSQGEMNPIKRRVDATIAYLEEHIEVRDVLISGGDPLLMSNEVLDSLLGRLRGISHIEFVRIGSRVPCFLPQRITQELVKVLRKHRVWLSVHFCHVRELTPEVAQVCDLLADGGIPLGCQTVLLKGVNDSERALRNLFHGLLKLRIRPYYIYQCDPVVGTGHLRTSIQTGLDLISKLRGHTTGYAVPTYVIDAPGGGGKVPIQPETLIAYENGQGLLQNWESKTFTYTDPVE